MFPQTLLPLKPIRKSAGKTTIAHLSDLHFTSNTNATDPLWQALRVDLQNREEGIDLIAVTGDLIDSPFLSEVGTRLGFKDEAREAFTSVHSYLESLAVDLNIKPTEGLVLVPGNHDYRLKGVFNRTAQSTRFAERFNGSFRPLLLPTLGVCIFVLDSNVVEKGVNLATGLIKKSDLLEFGQLAANLARNNPVDWFSSTKIVLLHHHPMPIAATEVSGLLEAPAFLMLKNAAQFMTTMVRSEIDLVLHGHQHYPGVSKASFPSDEGSEHTIIVVGAGSVAKDVPGSHRSYNLITITDSREVFLERRHLAGAGYEAAVPKKALRTYADARRVAFERLAEKAGAKMRVRKFSRLYTIKSGSGDADIYERLESVTAFSQEVHKFDTEVQSDSGFFFTPKYDPSDGQDIHWTWADTAISSKRKASVVFDPALTRDRAITFERRSKTFNLFHFNQQDRLDATKGESSREYIELAIQNAFDLLLLNVSFPEKNFPARFFREVHNEKCLGKTHDGSCVSDQLELDFFNLHFSKFKDSNTFVVSLEKPLPGYTYWISWELPFEDHEDELGPVEKGQARALMAKLLRLRSAGEDNDQIQSWFGTLRTDLVGSEMWKSLNGNDELELSLYAYDGQKRGLVCVATSPSASSTSDRMDEVIKTGETLVGAAYRRMEPMLYSPLAQGIIDEAEYEMRVPPSWRKEATDKYYAMWAIPLIYPLPKGRRVALLSISSKSYNSKLLNFIPSGPIDKFSDERDALVEDVMARQVRNLVNALNSPE